jgi:hypothetical protein
MTHSNTLGRRLSVILAVLVGLLVLACVLGGLRVAVQPGAAAIRLDSPPIGGQVYSLWVLPCDSWNPGQIVIGRNLWVFSSYPPPGLLNIPLAPACP